MAKLESETKFFHDVAQAILEMVRSNTNAAIVENKGVGDYSTQVDIAVEKLVATEIEKRFPGDQILAEEEHSDTAIPNTRVWIIDPICGTNNLGKGINNYCTNIALADGRKVIASCVIDHSQGQYFWSVGDNTVYVNDRPGQPPSPNFGLKIDIDFGSMRKLDAAQRQKYSDCLLSLINETEYDLVSLNTSLAFAYAAIGRTDGFINVYNHPWDICAASFLVQQAGGIVTGIDGSPWTISTVGAIGGRTPEIHAKLVDLFVKS